MTIVHSEPGLRLGVSEPSERNASAARLLPAVFAISCVYFILIGGTARGIDFLAAHIVNGVLIAGVVGWALVALHRSGDAVDGLVVVALILFLGTCLLSDYRRQSLDSAIAATGYASFFVVGRRLGSNEAARRVLARSLAVTAIALSTFFLVLWGGVWIQWLALAGSIPPLGLYFDTAGFAYRNDVPLLLALLGGCVWTERRWLGPFAAVAAVATVAVLTMSGARMVWLGTALAALVVTAVHSRPHIRIRSRARAAAFVVVAGVLAVAVGPQVIDRVLRMDTVAGRWLLWSSSLELFQRDPLLGSGPNSFPLASLTTTLTYRTPFSPEHADNSLIQLAGDSGLLGISAVLLLVVAAVAAIRKCRPWAPATWVALVYLSSTLTANPAENAFHTVPTIALVAMASPIASCGRRGLRPSPLALGVAGLAAAAALMTTSGGRIAYEIARASSDRGDLSEARDALTVATHLDPGQALYWRERGLVSLALGAHEASEHDLLKAVSLASGDTASIRAAATAARMRGDATQAMILTRHATRLRPLSADDLTARGLAALRAGLYEEARDTLVRTVRVAPWTVAADWWADTLPPGVSTEVLLDTAAAHALSYGVDHEGRSTDQLAWLALLSGNEELLSFSESSGFVSYALQQPLVHVSRCELREAAALGAMSSAQANNAQFWAGIVMARAMADDAPGAAYALSDLGTFGRLRPSSRPDRFLRDTDRDRWVYGNTPLWRTEFEQDLPNDSGLMTAVARPEVLAETVPSSFLAACTRVKAPGRLIAPSPSHGMVP
ncbi:MAG: O-antigen ligase family protein [Erythrobacter sp.]|nr:O-antigen ligase family protein [Erythrobacter sp.]